MADHILINRAVVEQALEALAVATNCLDGYYIPRGKPTLPEIEDAIATLRAALAQQAEPVHPSGFAYRYPDGVRFNDGCEVNGCLPSEVIPYYFGKAPPKAEPVRRAARPAPCARHCEATAFKIEIRRLQSELAGKQAAIAKVEEA